MINCQVRSRAAVNTTVPISGKDLVAPQPLSITAAEDDKVVEIGTGSFHCEGLLLSRFAVGSITGSILFGRFGDELAGFCVGHISTTLAIHAPTPSFSV
jgi:hypothetical protein